MQYLLTIFLNFVKIATDWYFILHSTALEDPTELRKNVKRILEVIVGLLKDGVSVSDEPANKKRCVEEKIRKK